MLGYLEVADLRLHPVLLLRQRIQIEQRGLGRWKLEPLTLHIVRLVHKVGHLNFLLLLKFVRLGLILSHKDCVTRLQRMLRPFLVLIILKFRRRSCILIPI